MENKVILISIDGMRSDGVKECGNPYVKELMEKCTYTFDAQTVFPSVTFPCHMSMFHSVPPERHGITTNIYMPPVRPIDGIFEVVKNAGGVSSMYYGWEQMRDVSRPGSLKTADFINARAFENTDSALTDRALSFIKEVKPDFVFLYMVETDEKGGHDNGWMSKEYMKILSTAIDNVKRVIEETGEEYTIIVTADHGGHDRGHGTQMPEDMTIPMFFFGKEFEAGKELHGINLLDLAPTIIDVMKLNSPEEWEGKSLLSKRGL